MPTPSPDINTYTDYMFKFMQRFGEISLEEFKQLASNFELRSFAKKAIILQAGEQENYISVVVKGLARKYFFRKGDEITLQLATEGHLIHSEISYHNRIPSDVAVEAIEATNLVSIHYDRVQQIIKLWPRAEQIGRLMMTYMFLKKDARYHSLLKNNIRQRFRDYLDQHPRILQRVPQKILASYLNIKPETFSRLKHLLKEGK